MVRISAGDLVGVHHACVTLAQMFHLFRDDDGLIPVHVSDRPQCAVRGVLVDMNPFGRVPKFEILGQLVDLMSTLKLNQLQAFVRLSKGGGWSFSANKCEMLSIDRYCKERFVDFVPAFDVDSSVAAADLRALVPAVKEIQGLFSQTRYVHIGPVLSTLLFGGNGDKGDQGNLVEALFPKAEVMFVCGNGLAAALGSDGEDLCYVPGLPMSAVVLHYGFGQSGGFTAALSRFQRAGHHVGVCTGTAAWDNLSGSPDLMLAAQSAAHSALGHLAGPGGAASGVSLVAHWSADPALAHTIFAWPGFLASAGLSWNSSTPLVSILGT